MPTEIPDTPQTRTEQYLAAANGQDVELPTPLTREEAYLHEIATKMQGGTPVLETLVVESNDTYTPDEGVDGFNRVEVDVTPNLEPLYTTENGDFFPENVDGFDFVSVQVPTNEFLDFRDDPQLQVDLQPIAYSMAAFIVTVNTSDGTIHCELYAPPLKVETKDTVSYSLNGNLLRVTAETKFAIMGVIYLVD